jgi:hypothetical protein
LLGAGKDVLPVELSFSSKKPLSFTAAIDVLDNTGKVFSINVTGTTDNSLLTVQPFLDWRDVELRVPSEKAAAAAAQEAAEAAKLGTVLRCGFNHSFSPAAIMKNIGSGFRYTRL